MSAARAAGIRQHLIFSGQSVRQGGRSEPAWFEQDTLLVLLILYVLLKDETGGIDRDLLLLAGIFLLIGL